MTSLPHQHGTSSSPLGCTIPNLLSFLGHWSSREYQQEHYPLSASSTDHQHRRPAKRSEGKPGLVSADRQSTSSCPQGRGRTVLRGYGAFSSRFPSRLATSYAQELLTDPTPAALSVSVVLVLRGSSRFEVIYHLPTTAVDCGVQQARTRST